MKVERNCPKGAIINLFGTVVNLDEFKDNSPEYRAKERILEQVDFEITHEPHFAGMEQRSKLIDLFKPYMPQLEYYQGGLVLEDGIKFSNTDLTETLCLKYTKSSFGTSDYKSFKDFSGKLLSFFTAYNDIAPMPQISRVSLRYKNHIKAKSFDEIIKLMDQFTFVKGTALLQAEITHLIQPGVLVKSCLCPILEDNEPSALEWDNEIYLDIIADFSVALKLLPLFHSVATDLFLNFLTDDLKQRLINLGAQK